MADVAELQVVVGADISDAEKGLTSLGKQVNDFSTTVGKTLAIASAAGFAAFGAAVGGAVTEAMSFEKTMSGVAAVTGATADEMANLSKLALQLGADTSFSAQEAASGIEELSKAGVGMADIMGGAAKASLDLAAAGGISVADSANLAAQAMNTFSLKGSDMAHVADLIAGAANASAIDVSQFKFSLQAVGAVAATVGLSIDDTAQAIAVLGQNGLVGSDAGTSLKTMLLNLQPSTKAATEEMKQLGIITKDGANAFFDAQGHAKSMAEIAGVLQKATAGLTDQQRLQALQTMFGTDAIRAASIMAKTGAAGFNEMADAINKVSASDVAEKRLDNLAGSIEKLKGSLSTVAITVGLSLTPALRRIVDAATTAVNGLIPVIQTFADELPSAIDAAVASLTELGQSFMTELQPAWSWVMAHADQIKTAFLGAAAAIAALVASQAVIPIIAAVGGALTALLSPIALVAAAGAALALAWRNNWLGIQQLTTEVVGWLTTTAWPMLTTAMTAVSDWVTTTFVPALTTLYTWLQTNLGTTLTTLATTVWPTLLVAMTAVYDWMTTTLVPALSTLWDWLGSKLGDALSWLRDKGWPALGDAMNAVQNWINDTLFPALSTLYDWLAPQLNAALTWLTGTGWPLLQKAMTVVYQWISDTLFPALSTLWDWLSPKLQAALEWLRNEGWPKLQTAMQATADYITNQAIPAFQNFHGELSKRGVYDDVAEGLWNIWQALSQINQTLPETSNQFQLGGGDAHTFADGIKAVTSAFAEWSRTAPYTIVDEFNQAVYQIRHTIWEGMAGLRDAAQWIADAMGTSIPDVFGRMPDEPQPPSPIQRPSAPPPSAPAPSPPSQPIQAMPPAPAPAPAPPPVTPVPTPAPPTNPLSPTGEALLQAIDAMGIQMHGTDFGHAATAIAISEGAAGDLTKPGAGGARGPFQFDPGGELPAWAAFLGMSVAEAGDYAGTHPMQAAQWALRGYLGDAILAGQAKGLRGQALANYGSRYGQRPQGSEIDDPNNPAAFWARAGRAHLARYGYAAGGWAGLHGPELALLGERGPEYVIPNNALRGMSDEQSMRVDIAVGGSIAEQIYVTGRDLAIRRGRVPSTVA